MSNNPFTGSPVPQMMPQPGMDYSNPFTGNLPPTGTNFDTPSLRNGRSLMTYSNLSTGQHVRRDIVSNGYTGQMHTSLEGYNDFTGMSGYKNIESNTFTGGFRATGGFQNDFTGTSGQSAESYDPFTGTYRADRNSFNPFTNTTRTSSVTQGRRPLPYPY
jgi:hypothetical protein